MTPEQKAFLAEAFADFHAFCGLISIVPKGGSRQKFILNSIQRRYCAQRSARDVVLKPRQIGFTTLEQARDVFHFLTVQGARVVVTCQSTTDRVPRNLLSNNFRVMFDGLEKLGLKMNFHTSAVSEWTIAERDASLRIVEAGASETSAAKKGRAGTITRLHLTETAFYEYAEDTLNALYECVPGPHTGAEIVSESTPNGAAGAFFTAYQDARKGKNSFKHHFFPWFLMEEYQTPLVPGEVIEPATERETHLVTRYGVTPEQLKWYRHKLADKGSQEKTDQEYPSDEDTCFLLSGRGFFDHAAIEALVRDERPPLYLGMGKHLRVWKSPEPEHPYLLVADPSEGGGADPSAAIVLDRGTGEHVATLPGQFPPFSFAEKIARLADRYNTATIVVERNNHGHAVLGRLKERAYPRIYIGKDEKAGWLTTEISRAASLDAFEESVRKRTWTTPDTLLRQEMSVFIVDKNGKAQAARGMNDDLVMCAAIGLSVLKRSSGPVLRAPPPVLVDFDRTSLG